MVNNDYTHWQHYAIGGSSSPTIFSQGNRFLAPNDEDHKEVRVTFCEVLSLPISISKEKPILVYVLNKFT